jgi:hypothetical protein
MRKWGYVRWRCGGGFRERPVLGPLLRLRTVACLGSPRAPAVIRSDIFYLLMGDIMTGKTVTRVHLYAAVYEKVGLSRVGIPGAGGVGVQRDHRLSGEGRDGEARIIRVVHCA